jgi:hypothetical protein
MKRIITVNSYCVDIELSNQGLKDPSKIEDCERATVAINLECVESIQKDPDGKVTIATISGNGYTTDSYTYEEVFQLWAGVEQVGFTCPDCGRVVTPS